MIKKVIVKVEETNGRLRVVGETYPKRADGLVKKGRARFESPDAIILNRLPPPFEMEENSLMNTTNTSVNINPSVVENLAAKGADAKMNDTSNEKLLSQLEFIVRDKSHIEGVLNALERTSTDMDSVDDSTSVTLKKIEAVAEVAKGKETTLQALIKLYGEMYGNLLTKEYLLSQLDFIVRDNSHIEGVLNALERIPTDMDSVDDSSSVTLRKIEAVAEVAKGKETTIQALIRLYGGMGGDALKAGDIR